MAHRSDAEQAGEIDTSGVVEGLDSTRGGAEPEPLGDDLIPQQLSVAAVPETRLEAGAAALPEAAPAAPYEPSHPEAAAALPPTPSFKPLDAIPTLMVEAALAPVALGPPEATRRRTGLRSPRPSLKPIIDPSEARPEPAGEQGAPTVAATGHTLPEALRALWTNLKMLLASAPASSDFRTRVGRADGNGGGGTSASSADGSNSSGGGNSPSGSGGTNARGGSSANGGSTSGGGGNSSSGGGSTSGGGGNSTSSGGSGSTASGGGSGSSASGGGSGSSASSGGSGSSVSSGGSGGRGRGNGGRGGRGGDDRDDDDRDGRGGGRGGDDDDDDD